MLVSDKFHAQLGVRDVAVGNPEIWPHVLAAVIGNQLEYVLGKVVAAATSGDAAMGCHQWVDSAAVNHSLQAAVIPIELDFRFGAGTNPEGAAYTTPGNCTAVEPPEYQDICGNVTVKLTDIYRDPKSMWVLPDYIQPAQLTSCFASCVVRSNPDGSGDDESFVSVALLVSQVYNAAVDKEPDLVFDAARDLARDLATKNRTISWRGQVGALFRAEAKAALISRSPMSIDFEAANGPDWAGWLHTSAQLPIVAGNTFPDALAAMSSYDQAHSRSTGTSTGASTTVPPTSAHSNIVLYAIVGSG